MYEVTRQLFWDPNNPGHANNKKSALLSQEVESIKHQLIMVDNEYEDRDNIACGNMSALWKMYPMMPALLDRDTMDDTSDYSDYDTYHIVDSIKYGM